MTTFAALDRRRNNALWAFEECITQYRQTVTRQLKAQADGKHEEARKQRCVRNVLANRVADRALWLASLGMEHFAREAVNTTDLIVSGFRVGENECLEHLPEER